MAKKETIPKVVPKREKGRPTKYTEALGDEICARLCEGESLLKICRDPKMPNRVTIHRWLLATHTNEAGETVKTFENFCNKYDIAIAVRTDLMFDEIEAIADETNDVIKKGAEKKSSAYASAQRLRVDTRKWYLSKVMPKKYGERQTVTTEDKDGNTMPITGNVITFARQDGKDSKSSS